MKNLLALLMFQTHNIHILHWKTVGDGFQPNHEYLDGLYSEMNSHIDLIAEMMLQRDENPITYQEMLEIANEKGWVILYPNEYYDEPSTFTHAQQIFEMVISEINTQFNDDTICRVHKSELETMQSWYMLKARYLFKNRLALYTKETPVTASVESTNVGGLFGELNELLKIEE